MLILFNENFTDHFNITCIYSCMRDKIYQASVSLTIECICLKEVTPVDLQNCTFCFQKRVIVLGYRVVGSILKNTTRMCYCSWLMLM